MGGCWLSLAITLWLVVKHLPESVYWQSMAHISGSSRFGFLYSRDRPLLMHLGPRRSCVWRIHLGREIVHCLFSAFIMESCAVFISLCVCYWLPHSSRASGGRNGFYVDTYPGIVLEVPLSPALSRLARSENLLNIVISRLRFGRKATGRFFASTLRQ